MDCPPKPSGNTARYTAKEKVGGMQRSSLEVFRDTGIKLSTTKLIMIDRRPLEAGLRPMIAAWLRHSIGGVVEERIVSREKVKTDDSGGGHSDN